MCPALDKTLAIHTAKKTRNLQPLQLRFNSDLDLEEWQADICHGMNSVRNIAGPPSAGSTFSVTARGEVAVFDPKVTEEAGCDPEIKKEDGQFSQNIPVEGQPLPIIRVLENG